MNISSKNKPKLEKKVTTKEKIISWYHRHKFTFIAFGILLFFVLFFSLLFIMTPPVESGQYYNHLQV